MNRETQIYQWEVIQRGGPVLATAVHMGHLIRPELRPYIAAADEDLRRDEDPQTGYWAGIGDDVFRTYTSRFEVDLNRSREKAFSTDPRDTWGLTFYEQQPPDEIVARSLAQHDAFYALMASWIEKRLAQHGRLLVLDLHSYNHRRGADERRGAPQEKNPDIDLGVTTLDADRFGGVVGALRDALAERRVEGRRMDVRCNVRYPDGGHFPEWIFEKYGSDVCTITLEVKKFYMDELTGSLSLRALDDLYQSLVHAKVAATQELLSCR